jgi:flagellar biosynthesis/type III secretory pathway protein FliH
MSQTVTVHLEKPITSVRILGDSAPVPCEGDKEGVGQIPIQDLQAEKTGLSQACRTLNAVVARLNQFCDTLFAEHKEEIAKLSVEIARKILLQKVQDGDYEIEGIVKEALNNAPTHQDVVVHLNPEDHLVCQKAQQDEPNGDLAGIKFVSDQNIGRAECLLETPKGIIESLIEEHLERIANALKKAE